MDKVGYLKLLELSTQLEIAAGEAVMVASSTIKIDSVSRKNLVGKTVVANSPLISR